MKMSAKTVGVAAALAVTLAMPFTLTACGGGSSDKAADQADQKQEQAAEPEKAQEKSEPGVVEVEKGKEAAEILDDRMYNKQENITYEEACEVMGCEGILESETDDVFEYCWYTADKGGRIKLIFKYWDSDEPILRGITTTGTLM